MEVEPGEVKGTEEEVIEGESGRKALERARKRVLRKIR